MLDDADQPKRRIQSAAAVRYRLEQRTMLTFRKRIGELQGRVAFAVARAVSGRTPAHGELEGELGAIRASVAALLGEIDTAVPEVSAGPADNCRRAMTVLVERLDSIAP